MFETSKDLLNIIIALCILTFTFFVSWALYYIVMMLKKTHLVISEVSSFITSLKEKLEKVEQLLATIEDKIKNSASYLPLVLKGVSELISYFKNKKEKKSQKK